MAQPNLTLDDFLSRFQLLRPQLHPTAANARQAAVLVPVVRREQPGLLLTQRSPRLRKHAGQVAFPGGAVDDTDTSLIAAALREAQEEVHPARLRRGYRCATSGLQSHRVSRDARCGDHSP